MGHSQLPGVKLGFFLFDIPSFFKMLWFCNVESGAGILFVFDDGGGVLYVCIKC